MKIVFMGTPEFSVLCLEQLINDGHDVQTVFTQPDKPKGRGNTVTASPVKLSAVKNGITVLQPQSLRNKDVWETISGLNPDFIVVVAYGKILPIEVLSIPKFGCINIHASLLPKYRGAAPIQWAIINGETETGITSMLMNAGLDTGDIILMEKTAIELNENAGDLFNRLSVIGASVLSKTLRVVSENTVTPAKQNERLSSYAPMLNKSLCEVDWNKPALEIHNLVRGLAPFLFATTSINDKVIRVISSLPCRYEKGSPGEVVESGSRLVVACADKTAIELLTLQTQGKRPLKTKEFLLGNRIRVGETLG